MYTLHHILFDEARLMLPHFISAHQSELHDRTGIVFATCYAESPPKAELIGELEPDVFTAKRELAFEKIARIRHNGEFTSFQSENEAQRQFGGAIWVAPDLWLSASGFPPDLDQEFLLELCQKCDLIHSEFVERIIHFSRERVAYWKGLRRAA